MRRNPLLALGVLLLIIGALAAKSLLIAVPAVHSTPGEFDAGRAKARLAFLLGDQSPHPADSAADDAVRARLIASLQQMGVKPIVRDQFTCNDFQKARLVACARVHNVIAILGPRTGKALLLSAHYDSVPVGPGASDDGVGVATLLEVGSILQHRPLQRPVILLFNEGEELGLIGARAFLADPLSRSVDSVLNFEARGVTGPATMFETSRPNAAAIQAFSSAVRRPYASSLSTDVYHLLPNDTDVTAYNERGWLTLNFAMAGNETRYHSPGDDLSGLDPKSLQHMGDQALAVSSELASSGLPRAEGQRIFMDVLGRWFVQMPLAVGLIIFVLVVLAFAALVWRRGAYGRALAAPFSAIILGSIAGWLGTVAMGAIRAGTYWRAQPEPSFVAIYAAVLLGALLALGTVGSKATRDELRAGTWLVFLLLGALLAAVAPGAIIYFLAPPIIVVIGAGASKWWRPAEDVAGLLAILVLYLTWGEMLALLEVLFSPGPLWIAAPVAAIMIVPALVEAHGVFGAVKRPVWLAGSAAIALVAWTVVGVLPAYSQHRQERFTIEHVTTFPSGKSSWSVLNDGAPLPASYSRAAKWSRRKLPFSDRQRWLAPAPSAGVKAPSVQPIEILQSGNERRIKLRLKENGAERILLIIPAEAHLRTAGADGFIRPIGGDAAASGKFNIACTGRNCDGVELTIDAATSKPIAVTIVGSRNGLPPTAAPLLAGRPANARPQYVPDETVAVAHVNL